MPLFPTIWGLTSPPSFRHRFSQKTVYLNMAHLRRLRGKEPPRRSETFFAKKRYTLIPLFPTIWGLRSHVIQRQFWPKNGIPQYLYRSTSCQSLRASDREPLKKSGRKSNLPPLTAVFINRRLIFFKGKSNKFESRYMLKIVQNVSKAKNYSTASSRRFLCCYCLQIYRTPPASKSQDPTRAVLFISMPRAAIAAALSRRNRSRGRPPVKKASTLSNTQ